MKIGRSDQGRAGGGSARDRALKELILFGFSSKFEPQMLRSYDSFWDGRPSRLRPAAARELEKNALSESVYLAWFLYDIPVDDRGRTILECYLERHGAGLSVEDYRYLEHLRQSHMRLYEVTERHQKRLCLTDVLTGDRVDARGRQQSRVMPGDLLAGRLTASMGGALDFENGAFMFPAELRPRVLERFRMARAFADQYESDTIFFKWSGFIFHLWWLDDVVLAPNRVH